MSVKTKKDFDYKKYYITSSKLGSTPSISHEIIQDREEVKETYGPKIPLKNTFSTFETTNQIEMNNKPFTVTETFRKPPALSNVEGLGSNSVFNEIANEYLYQPQNLAMKSTAQDSFNVQTPPLNVHEVSVKHASEYYNTFQNFKETLEKQNGPIKLLDKERFLTTKLELHDRKKQSTMNLEDKNFEYRDEQIRGKTMKSTFVPKRNASSILTKEDQSELRDTRYEKLSPIGYNATSSNSSFVNPQCQLTNNLHSSPNNMFINSQKMLSKTSERNYGELKTTSLEYIKPVPITNEVVSNPKFRRTQILKVGIHGEPIVSDHRAPNPDDFLKGH